MRFTAGKLWYAPETCKRTAAFMMPESAVVILKARRGLLASTQRCVAAFQIVCSTMTLERFFYLLA